MAREYQSCANEDDDHADIIPSVSLSRVAVIEPIFATSSRWWIGMKLKTRPAIPSKIRTTPTAVSARMGVLLGIFKQNSGLRNRFRALATGTDPIKPLPAVKTR